MKHKTMHYKNTLALWTPLQKTYEKQKNISQKHPRNMDSCPRKGMKN